MDDLDQPLNQALDRAIDAWAQTYAAVIALGDAMPEGGWDRPTECPEWTVKDVYAHLVGGEVWMSQGHPPAETGLARIADEPVAQRRHLDGPAVLAELREVFELRRRQLAQARPDPAAPTLTAYRQPVTVGLLYHHRAFDAWVHEQDIRRAIGVPGGLDTASAAISRDILLPSTPMVVAKRAGAPPGSTVRLLVEGAVPFDATVGIDENGKGRFVDAQPVPTAQLRMDWETYSRLAAGRITAANAAVEVTGDRDLADRVLARLAVTP